MAKATIAILGGAGNTGFRLARLLSEVGRYDLRLIGRNRASVDQAAARISAKTGAELTSASADSADRDGLLKALSGADLVVSATSAAQNAPTVASAALRLGIDYFDIHLSTPGKWRSLRFLEPDILSRGLQFVSDGGFHPGLPAAMFRKLATSIHLTHAPVYASFSVDWSRYDFGPGAADDFISELSEMDPSAFRDGRWIRSWRNYRAFDFGPPWGRQQTMAMGIEELRSLPDHFPQLRDTGFFIAGFGPMIDHLVLPITMLAMFLPPVRHLAALTFMAALKRWTRHEEWALLVCDGLGESNGQSTVARLRISHGDPYELTAIAAAACILEMTGDERRPGLFSQGLYVEPSVFFNHLRGMGVDIEESIVPA